MAIHHHPTLTIPTTETRGPIKFRVAPASQKLCPTFRQATVCGQHVQRGAEGARAQTTSRHGSLHRSRHARPVRQRQRRAAAGATRGGGCHGAFASCAAGPPVGATLGVTARPRGLRSPLPPQPPGPTRRRHPTNPLHVHRLPPPWLYAPGRWVARLNKTAWPTAPGPPLSRRCTLRCPGCRQQVRAPVDLGTTRSRPLSHPPALLQSLGRCLCC